MAENQEEGELIAHGCRSIQRGSGQANTAMSTSRRGGISERMLPTLNLRHQDQDGGRFPVPFRSVLPSVYPLPVVAIPSLALVASELVTMRMRI